jgi:hypothetical protein
MLIAAAMILAVHAPSLAARHNRPARTSVTTTDARLPPAGPQPGILQYNGDWAVGCDNLLRCEAIALRPETGDNDDEPILLQISRSGGAAGETLVRVSGLSQLPGDIALVLDGREAVRMTAQGDEAVLQGAAALGIVQAMGSAVTIELRIGGKKGKGAGPLATISAAGLADSLRFVDTRQGRTGTRSAFLARGDGADSGVPAPPSVPVVRQVPSPDADGAPGLTPPEMAVARKLAVCDPMLSAEGAIELFPLDHDSALLLLPCEAGAYNVSAVPLVAKGKAGERLLSIARFDFAPVGCEAWRALQPRQGSRHR